MGIEKMILCGHSLGGYVAAKYACKYTYRVISLVLISPAGVWKKPATLDQEFEAIIQKFGFVKRNVFKKAAGYWSPGKSPMQLLRKVGRVATFALNSYTKFFKKLTAEEQSDMKEYLFQVLMKPGTGELALGYILEPVMLSEIIGCVWSRPVRRTLKQTCFAN